MTEELAPAKVNLFLHVGPRRRDGLHAISSLFAFAQAGDFIRVAPAKDLSLAVTGPFAAALEGTPPADNLVLQAATALRAAAGIAAGARITLDKRLPVAAGLGGGSADAAAALLALSRLWGATISRARLSAAAFRLGADVPACLHRRAVLVGGAGEIVRDGPRLPPLWVCLANPGVSMSTREVFAAFDRASPTPPEPRPERLWTRYPNPAALQRFLGAQRNDLEPHAAARAPQIGLVLARLRGRPGCLLARMSGSGATAFGLFASGPAAERAARALTAEGYWSLAARLV